LTRESVINQLVYYLNYGFISKDLQEDIQDVLLNKKDIFVLERLLDSIEYELHKNTQDKYRNNDLNQNNIRTGIKKTKKINKKLNVKSKTKKILNAKHNNESGNSTSSLKETKQNNVLLHEDNNTIKINQFKITPTSLKILNKKKI
jgi:hypothetical protein